MKHIKFGNVLGFALIVTVGSVSMADSKNRLGSFSSHRSSANSSRPTMATHFGLESARTVLIRVQVKSSATVTTA
jgi:hypothetical protein